MGIQVYGLENEEKWNEIVRSFEEYDVYYLCGYVKAFQLHGDGEPLLFYYENDDIRGINVVMKRDIAHDPKFMGKIPEDTYFDFITPYGYGGWLIEGNGDLSHLYEEFQSYCIKNSVVSEFVRFHLFSNRTREYYGAFEPHTHNIVRELSLPLDEMLMDFEHKVRKNIKKAVREGLEVHMDETGERLDEFLRIYYDTMKRTNARDYFFFSQEFFRQLMEIPDGFVFAFVLYEGKPVSAELVLCGKENCYSYLGGTESDYFSLRPNDLLKYGVIQWAKEKGLKNFVLGGGYGADDGIFQYKKSFAPHGIYDFYIGKKIYLPVIYEKLLELRAGEKLNEGYFPAYRG